MIVDRIGSMTGNIEIPATNSQQITYLKAPMTSMSRSV
jgi:hypothetical protein